jgi:hypothetical protein
MPAFSHPSSTERCNKLDFRYLQSRRRAAATA